MNAKPNGPFFSVGCNVRLSTRDKTSCATLTFSRRSRQRRHPGSVFYRGSMVGLHVPLPTLRRHPRGYLRTARGRCGRYSFIVVDLHHLLLAGLPAHLCENAKTQFLHMV